MMTLPFNIASLYENKQLGVLYTGPSPLKVVNENDETIFQLEPTYVYPVIYLSLERATGVLLINEENAFLFGLESEWLEFVDMRSDVLN